MSNWDVVSEKPAPNDAWNVVSEKPAEKTPPDELSLGAGLVEAGKGVLKAGASLPVFAYEQVRHPIRTEKDIITGMADIPSAIKRRADESTQSIIEDLGRLPETKGAYQNTLRAGRAALTALGLPYNAVLGGVLEPTYGKAVGEANVGISPEDAANLPITELGAKAARKAAKPIAEGAGVVGRDIKVNLSAYTPSTPEHKAAEEIIKNLKNLHQAGGDAPETVVKMVKEARQSGTPLSFADVNEGNRRLAGVTFRKGDAGREIIRQQLAARDAAAEARLNKSLGTYLGSGSVRQTIDDVATVRSKTARPVFEHAMRDTKPLGEQYANLFKETSKRVEKHSLEVNQILSKISELKRKLKSNREVSSGIVMANEIKKAEGELSVKEIELKAAHDEKEAILQHLRENNKGQPQIPGAIWSPQIQRLVNNPEVRRGLNEGMVIERNVADSEGRAFNPNDYAITVGKNGELEISKTPNMRVLAVAKEGLDYALRRDNSEMWDQTTFRPTKKGLSVLGLRNSLVSELDRLNPKYKEARDIWAGESSKINAIKTGEDAFRMHPEDISKALSNMSESEKEFARMGLAEKMREKLLKTKINGDEAKALINNQWTQKQIRPFFKSDKDFNAFIKDVSAEKTMFESGVEIAKNSLTADRAAADMEDKLQSGVHAGKGVSDLMMGKLSGAVSTAISLWQKSKLWNDPVYNEAIARLLFDPKADFSQIDALLAKTSKNQP